MGCTCDEHLPRVRLNTGQNPKANANACLNPPKPPKKPVLQHQCFIENSAATKLAEERGYDKAFDFLNVRLRCFQSEEKLNSMGFHVVSFPPSTAHSASPNPKQAWVPPENQNLGADWITVLLSKSLKDRKYIRYHVEFLLRKRRKGGPPHSQRFWHSHSTQEVLRIIKALLPVLLDDGERAYQSLTLE